MPAGEFLRPEPLTSVIVGGERPCYEGSVRRRLFAFVIGVLLVPLLLASTGPAFARAIAGAAPHVCRCDARHTDCVCAICHRDREENRDEPSRPTMKGVCGDQDVAYEASHALGVLPPAAGALLPPAEVVFVEPRVSPQHDRVPSAPDSPPPRS